MCRFSILCNSRRHHSRCSLFNKLVYRSGPVLRELASERSQCLRLGHSDSTCSGFLGVASCDLCVDMTVSNSREPCPLCLPHGEGKDHCHSYYLRKCIYFMSATQKQAAYHLITSSIEWNLTELLLYCAFPTSHCFPQHPHPITDLHE